MANGLPETLKAFGGKLQAGAEAITGAASKVPDALTAPVKALGNALGVGGASAPGSPMPSKLGPAPAGSPSGTAVRYNRSGAPPEVIKVDDSIKMQKR